MANIQKNLDILNLKSITDIKDESVRSYTKLELTDNDGYKYYLSNDNLIVCIRRKGILSRFFNHNPFTEYNIRLYLKKNKNDDVIIISDIPKNAITKFKLFCNIHKQEFEHSWNQLSNGQFCPLCGRENSIGNGYKHTIEEVKELAEKYNITIVDDKYIDNLTPLAFVCNNHPEEGIQYRSWGGIITATHSCNYCASEAIIKSNSISHEQFTEKFKSCYNYNRLALIGKYEKCKDKIEVECKKCNHKFSLRPDHILRGVGCPECNVKSLGEEIIKYILNSWNIKFIREYRFHDCRDIKTLPFDFYLYDNNYCIEFDGKQHFIYDNTWIQSKEDFEIIQKHDAMKNEYCKNNNINLIRIPYWEMKNIENILKIKLKEVIKDDKRKENC